MAKQAIHKIFAFDKSSKPSKSKSESQAEEPESPDAPKKRRPLWTDSWLPEILSAVFSIICIALLIGFLVYIHGRPYATWRYSVSPNAIISIIVTAAKATILVLVPSCISQLKWNRYQSPTPLYHMQLYDQASRGAWGSFQILWRVTPGLATVAALLMILSLAIDPFAQQILAFPSRSVLAHNETASVQSAHAYGNTGNVSVKETVQNVNSDAELTPSMNAAILNGLAETHTPLEPQCTSGNCQYPDFVTLGFCSKCQNITSQTKQSCKPDAQIMQTLGKKFGWSDVILKAPENCTYTLPDGYEFLSRREDSSYNYTVWKQGLHDTPILSTQHAKWFAISRGNRPAVGIQQPLLSFISSKYADKVNVYTRDNYTVPEEMPTISVCALYPCEKQYKDNVYSGSDNHLRVYKDQQLGPNVNASDPNISQVTLVPPSQMEQLSPNSSYSIDGFTWAKLNTTLNELLNYYYSLGSPGLNRMVASIMGGVDDVGKAMDSMTTSMTDIIRSDTTAFTIPGEAFRDETYIHVRWPWIILPTLSVLFSIFLFVATSIMSRKLNAVLWKDSILPLLMFRLQTDSGEDTMCLSKVEEAERISKKINVVGPKKGSPLVLSEVNG